MLLDQRIVAGLGNIYVCEALYRAGIHPTPRRRVDLARTPEAAGAGDPRRACRGDRGGRLDLARFREPDGELGYFSKKFAVYDREGQPCACGGTVKRIVQGGRSTFCCPQVPTLTLPSGCG